MIFLICIYVCLYSVPMSHSLMNDFQHGLDSNTTVNDLSVVPLTMNNNMLLTPYDFCDLTLFVEEAENYYKDNVQLREWMQLDEDEEQIVALQARLDKVGKENNIPKGKKGKKHGKKGMKGEKKDDWTWKKVEPKGGEARSKSVYNKKEKKKMTYHWCTQHKLWTLHMNKECTKGEESGTPLADKTTKASTYGNKGKITKKTLTMRVLQTLAELTSYSECESP